MASRTRADGEGVGIHGAGIKPGASAMSGSGPYAEGEAAATAAGIVHRAEGITVLSTPSPAARLQSVRPSTASPLGLP
jgi:hypothetical protein